MNNKPKRYRLLKDLPDCKAGTILEKNSGSLYMYLGAFDGDDKNSWYISDTVENNPEWFEEIKEPEKIAVKHFGVMDDYPIKNRHNYTVCTSGEIPRHLFIIIEKAVERIINSPTFENEDDIKKYLERSQSVKYTQEELDKAIVDAFKAAGLSFSRMGKNFDSAEDYLKSLKK